MPITNHPSGDGIFVDEVHLPAETCSRLMRTETIEEFIEVLQETTGLSEEEAIRITETLSGSVPARRH